MKRYLIAEGNTDVVLLRKLIGADAAGDMHYMAAGGWSSADSLARSILASQDAKVAVVVDSDSTEPSMVEERRHFLRQSLGQIAEGARFRVIVIVPEIEGLLFDDRDVLEQVVGRPVSDLDIIEGRSSPKRVLSRISGRSTTELFQELSAPSVKALQDSPEIRELRRFLDIRERQEAA